MRPVPLALFCAFLLPALSTIALAQEPRARDLGIPFDGTQGALNAITDVAGVEVGFKTLISGEGKLVIGKGPVRTGVTAILPLGKTGSSSVFAGYFAGNGNGDMTGTHWIEESGLLETPILITNTGSVGVVRDAAVAWMVQHKHPGDFWYPVTAETADVPLNDIKGQHVTAQDTWDALNSARGGPVAEGNVGGGTGMICNGFKGGTGTSSRKLADSAGGYTVGVLVQCNYGNSDGLRVAGIHVAREMKLQPRCVEKRLDPPQRDFGGNLAPVCAGKVARTADRHPRSRRGLHHRDRGHRRSVDAGSAQASGAARLGGARPRGSDRGHRIGRYLPRVFNRQRRRRPGQQRGTALQCAQPENRAHAELENGRDVPRGCAGD